MPDIQILQRADYVLNKCGRPRPPQQGQSALYIRKGFLIQTTFAAATGPPTQTITKEITGDDLVNSWCLRGIQITSNTSTALSVQFLLPSGKFLINQLQDVLQIAGYGSYRYAFRPEWKIPVGSKIQVTFEVTNTTNQQPIAMEFDGAYQYLLKGGEGRICPVDEAVESLPRYFSDPNQNIMAPFWQHGIADPAPPGYFDEDFTYSASGPPSATFPAGTSGSSIDVTVANLTAIQQITIDASEFHCQRLLIKVEEDNTVTAGSVLARIRLGSGYAIFDDFLDAARYVGSTYWAIDLVIDPNDIVYADLLVVDQAGTGNIYWTMFLEGFKRKRRA
jgi:hypothetical protein